MGKFLIISCITLLSVSGLLISCNTSGCTEMRTSVPRADFYSAETEQKIIIDSLEIVGIGAPNDSILYKSGERLSSIYLPMPALIDKVEWRIGYMQKNLREFDIADTIKMKYKRYPWFAGEECGAMYKYKITELSYTQNLIDSIGLVDSLVINVDEPTLNIYFRTE